MTLVWEGERCEEQPRGEIRWTIDPNQLDLAPSDYPDYLECRFDTAQEAREVALVAANIVGHEVEVECHDFYGSHGRELIERFNVWPDNVASVINGVRDDLAEINKMMFGM